MLIVCHVKGVSTAVEREQGFREGLGDYNKNVVGCGYIVILSLTKPLSLQKN